MAFVSDMRGAIVPLCAYGYGSLAYYVHCTAVQSLILEEALCLIEFSLNWYRLDKLGMR